MAWPLAIVGGLMQAGGTFLKGRAGDIARKRLESIANTPGLDIGGLSREATRQALGLQLETLPQAEKVASEAARINQAALLAQEEAALPGAKSARQTALENVLSFLGDDKQWLEGIQRRGAALGLGRGLGGSSAARIGQLKLSDVESQQRKTLGAGLLGQLLGSLRIADTPGVQAFMAPTASSMVGTTLNIRGQERAQRMNLLAQGAGIPGQTAAWGNALFEAGGMLAGAGMMGMMGGGAAGGSSSAGNLMGYGGGGWPSWGAGTTSQTVGGWAGTGIGGGATTRAPFMGPQYYSYGGY
jgi:hypothetical protein